MRTRLAVIVLLAGLSGCLEQDLEVQLQADGRGTLRITQVLGAKASEMVLSFEADKEQAARAFAASQLADWRGIEAWDEVQAGVDPQGRIRLTARGWFQDLARVSDDEEGAGGDFELVRGPEGLKVKLALTGTEAEDDEELFTADEETYRAQKGMLEGMLAEMFEGVRMSWTIGLPGEPRRTSGFSRVEGRKASFSIDGERVKQMIAQLFREVEALRPKVKAGELSAKQAYEQVEKALGLVAPEAECPATPDPAASAAHDQGRLAALEAWKTSEWKTRVEQALREKAEDKRRESEGEGEGAPEAPPPPTPPPGPR